jgi:hypothetical protein
MALTKPLHLNDELKNPLGLDELKVDIMPKMIDNIINLESGRIVAQPVMPTVAPVKLKVKTVKAAKPRAATPRRSRLDRATMHLFDLDAGCKPEKALNIDLDLYQMEDF